MPFKDVKVTCIKAEGPCTRTKVGATFYVRNACLEIPENEKICLFALGSLMVPMSTAINLPEREKGCFDPHAIEWQCPDADAKVVFKVEEVPSV